MKAPDVVTITVDFGDISDIPPNPDVGRIWEIAINGKGYMLADTPENPETLPRRRAPSLDAPRLATSDTPFDQAIERYSFATFNDWEAGRGQRFLNREEATARAFLESEGVDPFSEKGALTLLPAMRRILQSLDENLRLVAVGDDLYVRLLPRGFRRWNGEGWDPSFQVSGTGTLTDVTSDGQYWYACDGSEIYRGTDDDPGTPWSTVPAVNVRWAAGRICAAVKAGSSTTPNRFTTLAPDGAEELEDGHLTLDDGHTIVLGGSAQGVFYFGSYVGDQGQIWAWQLGVDSEGNFHVPYVAWDMPQGLVPRAVSAHAGEVWIRAERAEGPDAGEVFIYRGIPGQGLTPVIAAELGKTRPEGTFGEIGDLVLFSWQNTAGTEDCLGAFYLPTGGHARWVSPHASGAVVDIVEWRGLPVIAVRGSGIWIQDTEAWEEQGWLRTSHVDGGSALTKIVDTFIMECRTLLPGQSIELNMSFGGVDAYIPIGSLTSAGAQRQTFQVGRSTVAFGAEFVLKGDGSAPVTLLFGQAKYHPLGISDKIMVKRIKLADSMSGLNGHPLPLEPGYAAREARNLESLSQTRAVFQDVDWHITQVTEIVEVVDVETEYRTIYDPQQGYNAVAAEVTVMLRRVCGRQ